MILPVVNATVSQILAGGDTADYDAAPGAGTPRWTGNAQGWVIEKMLTQIEGDSHNLVKETRLIMADYLARIERGDTVRYKDRHGLQVRAVRDIQENPVTGTVRLFLEDQ